MAAPAVEIQYCVPCGHLPRALDIQKSLLEHFGQKLDGVKLKTGDSGTFKIRLESEEIYDRSQEFDLDIIIAKVAEAAG